MATETRSDEMNKIGLEKVCLDGLGGAALIKRSGRRPGARLEDVRQARLARALQHEAPDDVVAYHGLHRVAAHEAHERLVVEVGHFHHHVPVEPVLLLRYALDPDPADGSSAVGGSAQAGSQQATQGGTHAGPQR